MKHAIVGSLTALLAGAGLALAQSDEVLPRPRTTSGAPAEASADLSGSGLVPAAPFGPPDAGAGYGPPPSIMCPVCGGIGTPFRFWVEGDYHLWWLKKNNFPPLLVAVPPGGLGAPGTEVLAGGNDLDRAMRNGGGLTLGGWVTEYQGFGLEGSFFVMESSSKDFSVNNGAAGSSAIVRPFFDTLSGQVFLAPVSVPGLVVGSASGATEGLQCESGRFAGANLDFIINICCDWTCRLDFIGGYRYLTLEDRFAMESGATAVSPGGLVLTNGQLVTSVTDRINTSSRFNGGEVGLRGEWHSDRFLVRAMAKVAFGASDLGADLNGVTSTLSPTGVPGFVNGGFLARPSNSGSFGTEQFAVVPEVGLTVGYQVCDWIKLTVGYTGLYWSSVVRSGGQATLNFNRLEVPSLSTASGFTPPHPLSELHCTDFWAHGINVGLEVRF